MRKNKYLVLLSLLFCLLQTTNIAAQTHVTKHKIAIFAPLYLDSAFDYDDEYRYSKNVFPKFINPGLEFYEGVQLAIDSLNKEKAPLEIFIYDTKSAKQSVQQSLKKAETDSISLMIVHCNGNEVKLFADAGLKNNVPVINVNLPNDGGAAGNPFFVVLNPTLRTQCEGIYKYIQKYYSLEPVIIFRKKGQLEDRIKSYFDEFGKNTVSVPLKFKYVELTDSFTVNQLKAHLDTTSQTVCIAGSLDEVFGKRLTKHLATLKKQNYDAIVVGMPTWDGIAFNKPEYKGIEIVFSTPFYHSKIDKVSQSITHHFNKVMFARPSDMVFRGYEVMFRYGRLALQYGKELASNLANKQTKIFTDFDIQPVLNKQSMTLDYFENKKLYFLKWQDGALKGVY
jgi:hypothetical protein